MKKIENVIDELRKELLGNEYSFIELDNYMESNYNSPSEMDVIEDYAMENKSITYIIQLEDEYNCKENFYINIEFSVIIKNGEDEGIGASVIKITDIYEI